jgi:hypothetical protein
LKSDSLVLKGLVIPLALAFFTPLAISASSQITTGNALLFMVQAPLWSWIGFGVGIVVWVLISAIRIRNKRKLYSGGVVIATEHGIPVFDYRYEGVIWVVCSTYPEDIKRSLITVKYVPLCPTCRTELEQNENFWYLYDWSCPRGDFKTRNKSGFSVMSDRAERLAKSDIMNRM